MVHCRTSIDLGSFVDLPLTEEISDLRCAAPVRFEHSNGDVYEGGFVKGAAHGQGGDLKVDDHES